MNSIFFPNYLMKFLIHFRFKNKLIRAKETINLRRKFTGKIINEVSNGIIYLDLNDKVLLFNKKSEDIFGKNLKKNFLKKNPQINQVVKNFKIEESFHSESR